VIWTVLAGLYPVEALEEMRAHYELSRENAEMAA